MARIVLVIEVDGDDIDPERLDPVNVAATLLAFGEAGAELDADAEVLAAQWVDEGGDLPNMAELFDGVET